MPSAIIIEGASTHNLKHISLRLPHGQLVVVTGVSGSGKSSLVFDTIFAEGQRRYIESLSTYARQYVGQSEKPPVGFIDGMAPAIAIDQKTTQRGHRSTVGTVTEIYDYFRVLFARVGTPHCPHCALPVHKQALSQMLEVLLKKPSGSRLQILAPVVRGRKGDYNALFSQLRKQGYARVRIDETLHLLDDLPEDYRLNRNQAHQIEVVIDRIVLSQDATQPDETTTLRLQQALEKALDKADGFVTVETLDDQHQVDEIQRFSRLHACPQCDFSFDELAPRLFSFNSPYGACPACHGLGLSFHLDAQRVVPDAKKSLAQGAMVPFEKLLGRHATTFLAQLCQQKGIDIQQPFEQLNAAQQNFLLHGKFLENQSSSGQKRKKIIIDKHDAFADLWLTLIDDYQGLLPVMTTLLKTGSDSTKRYLEQFLIECPCEACHGSRLKPTSLSVTLGGQNIAQLTALSLEQLWDFCKTLPAKLDSIQLTIARQPLSDVQDCLSYLCQLGLGYLSLDRRAETLSGGESQRLRLASQIGVGLSGILYVLDEPSIGLHPHNTSQLIETLKRLRDKGNSVIVVEHDEDTIRAADWLVEIGPLAGRHGGQVVAEGELAALLKNPPSQSLTLQYLTQQKTLAPKITYRQNDAPPIVLKGVNTHNLKNLTVQLPVKKLLAVTGPSGSGKSTLVFDVLQHVWQNQQNPSGHPLAPDTCHSATGLAQFDKLIVMDQSPIGRTRRSNPATYTGLMDTIRLLFANTPHGKAMGYTPGRFSFNVKGGRCETCKGDGALTTPMQFLPDVVTLCEVCLGSRYHIDTLGVTYHGKNIAQVLAMTLGEAASFFEHQPLLAPALQLLCDVGLDYLTLGQPAPTLSGGEAQRLKLASELLKRQTGNTLYLLDEPTVGLHWHDLEKLLSLLNRLVDAGNTIVVVEHHPDFIRACDWVIDLGPEGGQAGGYVVAAGTPAQLKVNQNSLTGRYL